MERKQRMRPASGETLKRKGENTPLLPHPWHYYPLEVKIIGTRPDTTALGKILEWLTWILRQQHYMNYSPKACPNAWIQSRPDSDLVQGLSQLWILCSVPYTHIRPGYAGNLWKNEILVEINGPNMNETPKWPLIKPRGFIRKNLKSEIFACSQSSWRLLDLSWSDPEWLLPTAAFLPPLP